ncbi:MAG: rhamnulokinase, partial [Halanaerobiales bacterium]
IGASNGRAILGKYDGEKIDLEVIHKFPNGAETAGKDQFWDILRLLKEVKTGLRKAVKTEESIASIGIDTWAVDYGLLDEKDTLMSNPYFYRDKRTNNLVKEVTDILSRDKVYQKTGIQFMQINTLYQLYADKKYRPWILDNAESMLFIPDLLNFFLTGKKYNEYTNVSTSQMYNPVQEKWVDSFFEELDIPQNIVNELTYPGNKIGNLTSDIKMECGLDYNIPVMAVGSHDTASAVAATPFQDRNKSIYISTGTWCLLGMELDKPFINSESLKENFTNELGVEKRVRFLKNICGLWLIQETKKSWERQGMKLTYDEIEEAAEKAGPAKFKIDPNDDKFLNPEDMPQAIREYCRETGQNVPEDYGELARGIYESLAESYNKLIDKLEQMLEVNIEVINMVGGGIKDELLCQFTANATGRKVITGPVEATAMGNILVQLMALGEVENLKQGREVIKNSISLNKYFPVK